MTGNYTRFRSTDPLNATALNQRFDELSTAVDDVVRVASDVDYTPAAPENWNPDPTTVQAALDAAAAQLIVLSNRRYCNGLEVEAFASGNSVTVHEGTCLSDDGTGLITVPTASPLSIDMTATGINGHDTGSPSGWCSIWVCRGTSGVGAIASNSLTTPTLPSGYDDYKRRIGFVRVNTGTVVSQYMPRGQGNSRRVYYTEVTNAAPYQILNEANIGQSGSQTNVDCGAIVAPTSRTVIAQIECNTPGGAADVFWNANDARNRFIMSLPATAFAFNIMMELEVEWNLALARIYSDAAVDEDLSLVVMGYIDDGLQVLGYTP